MGKKKTVAIPIAGQYGIVVDVSPQEMPLNAWSGGKNVRFRDGYVEKFFGHVAVFDPPVVPPYWALPVPTVQGLLWLYAGLQKVYAWDGAAHFNITRQTASVDVDYSANATLNWTGGLLGGVPVINNGVDAPQMWFPAETGVKLEELGNWPALTTCRAFRSFKQYLLAMDVTKNTDRFPFMVKWSHAADPGDIPVSWDETDETRDAGEYEIKESGGFVLDSIPLKDTNVIYKEDEIWAQQYIGGINIFKFFRLFGTIGALSRRCAIEIPGGYHLVFGSNDIIKHNGVEATSILEGKYQRRIYSTIDPDNFAKCFVAVNKAAREVWFCYPETGNTLPNIALVWNMKTGALGLRDIPNVTHIAAGLVNLGVNSDLWSSNDGTWDDWAQAWGEREFNPSQEKLLLCNPVLTKLFRADTDTTFDLQPMESYIERVGLGFPLKTGESPDFTSKKFVSRIWPRISGTIGGVVNVHLGTQEKVDGPVTYKPSKPFVIGQQEHVDIMADSRLHALKFSSDTALEWKLHSYDVDVRKSGEM